MQDKTSPFKIALISMPWSIFNRPSVQIGALTAYLEQDDGIIVDSFHPYLGVAKTISTETYLYLCQNSWAGEALYASILFPERKLKAQQIFKKCCADNKKIAQNFDSLRNTLQNHLDNWVEDTDFSKYPLIGFSVCFSQLFASLLASLKVKEKVPDSAIVFGGSSCVGEIGKSLLGQFSQIDYVVDGEGEIPLKTLCGFLVKKRDTLPQQIRSKVPATQVSCGNVDDLNTLPTPDYLSYFKELSSQFPDQPFIPILPLEFSRGCWWRKCTFCNLNLQWRGYRWKNSDKMMAELKTLLKKHKCLDFTFCDNALPSKETDSFFQKTLQSGEDFRFFAEIRAIRDPQKLSLYRSGGLTSVQVGIESLSNTLLEKMAKGTTVIENLAVMKHCLECGMVLEGNLIVEFPGSTEAEIAETLVNLDFALPFNPLSPASFFLGYGSPMEKNPHQFGISVITDHPHNVRLFPENLFENMEMLIKDFRGDKMKQKALWKPVTEKLRRWKFFHKNRKNKTIAPLSYRDGGTFIVIRQERPHGKPLLHRLQGTSRQLYLFCGTIRSLSEIRQEFSTLAEKTLLNFFSDLCNKNLLFREKNTFLALAVHPQKPSRQ